jgi:hypothetical protein
MYTALKEHNISYHVYADDMQLYISFHQSDMDLAIDRLQSCVNDIRKWMTTNYLKLNDDKTELLVFGAKNVLSQLPQDLSLTVGCAKVIPSMSTRNLGIIFHQNMAMTEHITALCKSLSYTLYNISRLRKYLTVTSAKKVINALIISKLDYQNGLMYGIPKQHTAPLQRTLNMAVRVVFQLSRYDSVTPYLAQLKWLPITYRIKYKILTLTFNAIKEQSPAYIYSLLEEYIPTRTLRSAEEGYLKIPRTRLTTMGDRAFSACAPKLWNTLPKYIRDIENATKFKRELKNLFLTQAYPDDN